MRVTFKAEGKHMPDETPNAAEPTTRTLFPERLNYAELAKAINPMKPPGERTVRFLMDRLRVPYIKVANERLYDINDVKEAILADERGRPRYVRRGGRPRSTQKIFEREMEEAGA